MVDTSSDVVESKVSLNAETGDPQKSAFDWMDLAKVVAMPLVTLLVGAYFSYTLNLHQQTDQDSRLYAEMMSRREESDTNLRKDMFQLSMSTFLKREEKQPRTQDVEQEVLNIEMLAYNFHESLDLSPLFKHVQRDVASAGQEGLLKRVEKVAKEVKMRQLEILGDKGEVEYATFDLDALMPLASISFQKSLIEPPAGKLRGGPTLCMSIESDRGERHWRQFALRFLDFNQDRREAEMSLSVSKPLAEAQCKVIQGSKEEQDNLEAQAQFWVGLFAFPMIDNTHLSHSERCAISVTDIPAPNLMRIGVAFFQASRASLKDRMYYDEIRHDVLGAEKP